MAAELEQRGVALLVCGEHQVAQAQHLGTGPVLECDVGVGLAADERERVVGFDECHVWTSIEPACTRASDCVSQQQVVEAIAVHRNRVPGRSGDDRRATEHPAQMGDVNLDRGRRCRGRAVAPERIGERVDGHHTARVDEQTSEKRTRFAAWQPHHPVRPAHLDRSEDPEIHGGSA